MRHFVLTTVLAAISMAASAQQTNQQNQKLRVSVFNNFHNKTLTNRTDTGLYKKLEVKFPNWMIGTDRITGGFKELNGVPFSVPGSTLEEKARSLMANQLAVAGIREKEWKLAGQQVHPKGFRYVYFYQEVAGRKVTFAQMNFRFTADGEIARITMKGYGAPDASLYPKLDKYKALDAGRSGLEKASLTSSQIEDEWEWFPVPAGNTYLLRPAYRFSMEGAMDDVGVPLNVFGYVDGISGEVLYRDNQVREISDLQVVGTIYTDGYLSAPKLTGLPNLKVKIGADSLYTNDTGYFTTAFPLPATYNISLQGKWSVIRSAPHSYATPSLSSTVTALGSTDSFNASSPSSSRHINAYYHVNTVHDFMKIQYPSFSGLDYPLVTNVDVSGACNAFYNPGGSSSINFFPAGGGCVSYAEVRDVVYHEYGHAIADKLYRSLKGSGMFNGALNEGQADVWGLGVTGDPVLARGSMGGSGTFIRRYDGAPKVFPKDLVGQVHADGQIIAGAWWDYALNVGSKDSMAKLFSQTLYDVPDGPDGTEGEIYYEILMSALINDDDDADLSNGTPHFKEIVEAFAKHGILLLQDLQIEHTELAHQPKGVPISVSAKITAKNQSFFQSLSLVYRTSRLTGSAWDTIAMTDAGGFVFSATIPAQSEGTIVDYYFAAKDLLNNEGVFFPKNYYPSSILPESKVNLTYQFGVGLSRYWTYDFESPLSSDWQIGTTSDDASTGKWIQARPVASFYNSLPSQTGTDHTSGSGQCLVTGNGGTGFDAYTQSVKNGRTVVLTPFFDLERFSNPVVEYYRWYGNDRGYYPKNDYWRVQMSSGSPIFLRDVDYTNQPDHQWRRKLFKPLDVFPGAKKMQLKFTASEQPPSGEPGNSLVEAAIDDIVIYEGREGVLGINEPSAQMAVIYPNPAIGEVHIELPEILSERISVELYDISGKIVRSAHIAAGQRKLSMSTKELPSGQYFVVITMDKMTQSRKLTVLAQ
jgi:Secretion system C-terminal sorting domain